MMGSRRNRGRYNEQECPYGCCRSAPKSKAERRTQRTREKREWSKEVRVD